MGASESHMSKMLNYFLSRDDAVAQLDSRAVCAQEEKLLNIKIRNIYCDKVVQLLSETYPEEMKIFPIVFNKMYEDYVKYKKHNHDKRDYTKSITWLEGLPERCIRILDILAQAIYSEKLVTSQDENLNIHLKEIYGYHLISNFVIKSKSKNYNDVKGILIMLNMNFENVLSPSDEDDISEEDKIDKLISTFTKAISQLNIIPDA
jgi:hypothetical protein